MMVWPLCSDFNTEPPPTPEPPVPGYCEDGWTAFGSSCYIVGTGKYATATYKDAYYDCNKIYGGAHVATIGNKAENTFVMNLVRNKFSVSWILIGLERTPEGESLDISYLLFLSCRSRDSRYMSGYNRTYQT